MRALVVYSSKTGNTKAIAEVAAEAFGHDTVLAPIAEAPDYHEFDLVAVGFWIDKGHPNHEIQKYIRRLKGKKVVLFFTLGANPDSEHAQEFAADPVCDEFRRLRRLRRRRRPPSF